MDTRLCLPVSVIVMIFFETMTERTPSQSESQSRSLSKSKSGQQTPTQFPFAGQPDIVRCHIKDQMYRQMLLSRTEDIARTWLGNRFYMVFRKEICLFSDSVYYAATTLLGIFYPSIFMTLLFWINRSILIKEIKHWEKSSQRLCKSTAQL
jgi:hypothetical protein